MFVEFWTNCLNLMDEAVSVCVINGVALLGILNFDALDMFI